MKIHLDHNGHASGPFSQDELQEKIYSGDLSRTTPARLDGTGDWVALESLLSRKTATRSDREISPTTVSLEQLRDRHERTALIWLYIASIPTWILFLIWTYVSLGLSLLVVGVFELFNIIGRMWFSAHLKVNAVRVSETQLPDLNRAVDACCRNLALERPEVYVIQHNVWNAFATKIFKRRVVVLYSGAVDSILLKGDMQQLTWLIGHELGHHWAGHLNSSQKLAKLGGWLIWVNLWHSRRAELTCDRVGLYCAGSLAASQLALMNATVGAQLADRVNVTAAAEQWQRHRGEFFVKYRTLYSTHPHLLARLDHLNGAAQELGISR